jgi:hypothetical protein
MKRFVVIVCSLFIVFAGAVSAWADCKQEPLPIDRQNRPVAHAHDHHSDANHKHSDARIHCPTLDEFLLSSTFSLSKDHRELRTRDPFCAVVDCQVSQDVSRWLIDGPPGFSRLDSIPPYLLLSVLRI